MATAIKPEVTGLNVVLLGDFNPKIFQPAWFAAEGLLQKQETDRAKIEVLHHEISIFELDWLRLQVTRERFAIETTQEPYYEPLRDLALGTFDLLRHTPIGKLGINVNLHFRMKSEEEWHDFGDQVAPKEIWNNILEKPGLFSLIMEGNHSRDGIKGCMRVKIEPSKKIHPGIYFNINDHYEVDNIESVIGSDEIIEILKKTWSGSLKRSKEIVDNLM